MDIQIAVGLGRVPLFPAFHSLNEDSLSPSLSRAAAQPPLTHLLNIGGASKTNTVSSLLRSFMTIRQCLAAQASAAVSAHIIRVLGNSADRSILSSLYGEPVDDSLVSYGQKRISALMVAAQIFLHIVLRQVPMHSPIIHILCDRLRRTLGDTKSVRLSWVRHHRALLWILFVGIMGKGPTIENEETQWYMSLVKSIFSEQALDPFQSGSYKRERLRRILSNFLWEESSCTPVLHVIIPPYAEVYKAAMAAHRN